MVLDSFDALIERALSSGDTPESVGPFSLWAELTARCCRVAGGKPETGTALGRAVHAYFVSADILDDVEDNDGLSTLWQSVGLGPAVNAGSGLLLLALHSLLGMAKLEIPANRLLPMARCLTGAGIRACRGQHIDLTEGASERMTLSRYYRVMNLKAGSLVAAACALGAMGAGAGGEAVKLVASFGLHLGISLQIANDSRSLLQPSSAKNDWNSGKRTLPLLYTLRQSPLSVSRRLDELRATGTHTAREEALAFIEAIGGFAFADSVRYAELDFANRRLEALRRRGVDTSLLQEVIRIP